MFEFWAAFETNFTGKTCTLEAKTSVFISADKKEIVFRSDVIL